MVDYVVRATAENNQIRAFAATTKELTEAARKAHNTSPIATAALGRLLTAGAMMGYMMKGEKDLLTLRIKGEGPIGGLLVTADSHGKVKGYVNNPVVMLPPNSQGKLNVGEAIGSGMLSVTKDMGLKEPYVGQTALQTGEIAEDLTYYFVASEQIASSVGLGVLMSLDNTVKQAGGFIIQLMPFTDDKVTDALEKKLAKLTSVTAMLDLGYTPEKILEYILGDFDLAIQDRQPAQFYCNCDRKRVEKALISMGRRELQEMIDEGKPIELNCHFCNTNYEFTVTDLKQIAAGSRCRIGKPKNGQK